MHESQQMTAPQFFTRSHAYAGFERTD
jgi:hypothetical protein